MTHFKYKVQLTAGIRWPAPHKDKASNHLPSDEAQPTTKRATEHQQVFTKAKLTPKVFYYKAMKTTVLMQPGLYTAKHQMVHSQVDLKKPLEKGEYEQHTVVFANAKSVFRVIVFLLAVYVPVLG